MIINAPICVIVVSIVCFSINVIVYFLYVSFYFGVHDGLQRHSGLPAHAILDPFIVQNIPFGHCDWLQLGERWSHPTLCSIDTNDVLLEVCVKNK